MKTQLTLTGGAELTICRDEFQDFIFLLDKPDGRNTETGRIAVYLSENDITEIGKIMAELR